MFARHDQRPDRWEEGKYLIDQIVGGERLGYECPAACGDTAFALSRNRIGAQRDYRHVDVLGGHRGKDIEAIDFGNQQVEHQLVELSRAAPAEHPGAAPFAAPGLKFITAADPADSTADPVPYCRIQYVTAPEFPGPGTTVGQNISSAPADQVAAEDALATSQAAARRYMDRAAYIE